MGQAQVGGRNRSTRVELTGSLQTAAPGGIVTDAFPLNVSPQSDGGRIASALLRGTICAVPTTGKQSAHLQYRMLHSDRT